MPCGHNPLRLITCPLHRLAARLRREPRRQAHRSPVSHGAFTEMEDRSSITSSSLDANESVVRSGWRKSPPAAPGATDSLPPIGTVSDPAVQNTAATQLPATPAASPDKAIARTGNGGIESLLAKSVPHDAPAEPGCLRLMDNGGGSR